MWRKFYITSSLKKKKKVLMMKEVGDWVKAQSTIWYSNLFMIKYEN
jgi:hypothetical protein